MPEPIALSRDAARRFLVRRHLLAPPRSLPAEPESVLRVVERLGSLQFDPLEVAGRNHDLVLHARIAGYRREWTDRALYEERRLYETYNKQLQLLPTDELPAYRIWWDRIRRYHERTTFADHAEAVGAILARIRDGGPVTSAEVDAGEAIDWYWGPTRRGRALLEALVESGVIAIERREGNRKRYDLTERLFPEALLAEQRAERDQLRHLLLSRYRAHGLLGTTGDATIWSGIRPDGEVPWRGGDGGALRRELLDELVEDGALVPVTVDGVRGQRYVLAGELATLEGAIAEVGDSMSSSMEGSGVVFLAPLDPLAWDRAFLRSLYDFDYTWEVYTPAAKRRFGYYVLPLLFGDRLVGRIEPRIHRVAGRVEIIGTWWEEGFDPLAADGFVAALAAALDAYRSFAGAETIAFAAGSRRVPLAHALAERLPAVRLRVSSAGRGRSAGRDRPVRRTIPAHDRTRELPRTLQRPEDPMAAIRRADVTWTGTLAAGGGLVSASTSKAFSSLPVSWPARTEAADGKTSPEELLAAAHAACYAMAFSGRLGRNETPPTSLDVSVSITFDNVDGGWKVASSAITVRGVVPGIDAATFRELAEAAKDGCPISGALKGNVAISVDATLAS